jgi:hypothetical protein
MSGLDRFRNSRTTRTIGGVVNNRIGDVVRDISDPTLRNGVSQILDAISPGLGGGTPDLTDFNGNNAFRQIYLRSLREQANEISNRLDTPTSSKLSDSYDWRARLRPKRGGADKFYAESEPLGFAVDALMAPIRESGGLVWKNMPSVFMSAMANYSDAGQGQGTNYPIRTYQNSTVQPIPVQADFTANDIYEARYLLGVFTFLKIATKAYFGDQAVAKGNYGTPPPVLLFEYLGDHGFNKVPVVVESYTYNLQNDVDYVPVEVEGTVTYVPTIVNISLTLMPQYTPHKLRRTFDLDRLANGAAYRNGYI